MEQIGVSTTATTTTTTTTTTIAVTITMYNVIGLYEYLQIKRIIHVYVSL